MFELILVLTLSIALGISFFFIFGGKGLNIGQYGYIITRIRVMNSKHLQDQKLDNLIDCTKPEEVIGTFEGTVYEEYLPQTLEIHKIETSLSKCLNNAYLKISKMVPKTSQEFFSLAAKRYDLENLKKLIYAKSVGEQVEDLLPSTFSEQFQQKLIEANSVGEITELCRGTRFCKVFENIPLNSHVTDYLRELDKYLYEEILRKDKIMQIASNSGVPNDKEYLTKVYGMQADILNIKILLRAKRDGLSADRVKKILVKNYFDLDEKKVDALADCDSANSMIGLLENTPYYSVLNEVIQKQGTDKLIEFEKALDKFYINNVKGIFMKQPFGVTPIACFLLIKENEIKNIQTILNGIDHGLQKNEIKEMVIA